MVRANFHSRRVTLRDGRVVTVRAIRESDASEILQAFERLSLASRHNRFMHAKNALTADEVSSGVRPQPGHAFAIVATVPADDGIDVVGAAQFQSHDGAAGEPGPDAGAPRSCEFAITVAEDWRGSGLARRLLTRVVNRARREGYATIEGWVLASNTRMLALARRMKFSVRPVPGDATVLVVSRALQGKSRAS